MKSRGQYLYTRRFLIFEEKKKFWLQRQISDVFELNPMSKKYGQNNGFNF